MKCCRKCAYRHGSLERKDEWAWLMLQEDRDGNQMEFYCHESAPGHYMEVKDDRPRWRECAGWRHTKHLPFQTLMRRTALDE